MAKEFWIVIVFATWMAVGCKKNYRCECTKTSTNGVVLDSQELKLKSKNRKQAYHDCLNGYLDKHPAPNSTGEISCNID